MTEQLELPLELEYTREAEPTSPATVQTQVLITEAGAERLDSFPFEMI